MEKCICGTEKISISQFWCGEWEEVDVCPKCDIGTDQDSGMIFLF